jgi:transcriptional regulator with XRE-family HTH domain
MRTEIEKIYQIIGSQIAANRKHLKITQKNLSKKIGITQQLLTAIEHGNRRISLRHLIQISDALHIDINILLQHHPKNNKPGPKSKLLIAFEKLERLPEKNQNAVIEIIESLYNKSQEKK